MLLYKSSILINILDYSNIHEICNMFVTNTSIKDIILKSPINTIIVKRKLLYIKTLLIKNSCEIQMSIKSIKTTCPHLYLLSSNKQMSEYIDGPSYSRQCVICDFNISHGKYIYHNQRETNWQYYLRNQNIQHELLLRTDANKQPNIMNVMTMDLNCLYNTQANRYCYIRINIIQKINALQLLITSYCDDKSNLLLNKSWCQFLIKNREPIQRFTWNKRKIETILFENEILNYKVNLLKCSRQCSHIYKQYKSDYCIKYCLKCKNIIHTDDNYYRNTKRSKVV